MAKLEFKKGLKIASIDFSDGWLRIAQAQVGSGEANTAPLTSAVEFNVERDDKASRKEFNILVWSALKARPEAIFTCLPRHYATVRFLRLPSSDAAEIESMIEFQATKQLPFSKEDIVTGYKVLGADQDGFSKVMLAVVQKNIIDRHLGALKAAGIMMPAAICLSTEALFNWFLSTNCAKQISDSSFYLLADIDNLFTELLICARGRILFTRSFEHGAGALYKLDKERQDLSIWVDILKEQFRLSYLAYKKENTAENNPVQKIFITGGALKFFGRIKEGLEKEFDVPVEFCGKNETGFQDKPVSFSKIIGMIRAPEKNSINLIPQESKTRRANKQKKEELFKFYALSALILLCLFMLLGSRFFYKKLYLNYLDARLEQIRPYAERVGALTDKLKIARQQSDKSSAPIEILRELYSIIPSDISISSFSISDERVVTIRGTSRSMLRVFEMVPILENSKYLKNVKAIFTNKRKIGQEEIVDFQLQGAVE